MQLDWRRRKGHLLAPLDDKIKRPDALLEYEEVDHDWLDKATQSDDGESRWEHLRDQEATHE